MVLADDDSIQNRFVPVRQRDKSGTERPILDPCAKALMRRAFQVHRQEIAGTSRAQDGLLMGFVALGARDK